MSGGYRPEDEASRADVPDQQPPGLVAGCPRAPMLTHDVALLDLDGVVYVGAQAVPGVPRSLAAARAAGLRLGFVTNNAARPPDEVARHLCALGVPATAADVITSAQAAAGVVRRRWGPGARVLPVGGPGVVAALEDAGLRPVDRAEDGPVAVVQGYGRDVGWAQLAEAVVAVRRGAVHVATNPDVSVPSPRGPLPGNGALVAAVRAVTGRPVLVAGKPQPAMHAECLRRTGAERPVVVGDRLDTDIEGGRRVGATTMLVLSGIADAAGVLAAAPSHRPDLLAADVSGLLRAHPPVRPGGDGAWRCGTWTARRAGGGGALVLEVSVAAGDPVGPVDRLDGLRALCVAHWADHPGRGAPAEVAGAGEAARSALAGWGLDR